MSLTRSVRPGDLLAGRYEVLRLVGVGARKQVHVARDQWLDREVAVCSLQPSCAPEEAARLRREATLLARLGDHPSVVAVHDLLEIAGAPVMVCRYLSGGSLQDRLQGVGLPVADAAAIATDVAAALSRAHRMSVVHRDVKPANIWLDESGRAVLGDFGLATASGPAAPDDDQPEELLVGTPAYVAPEQLVHGAVEPRSDLYSLGVVLFELLVGRPPFVDSSVLGTVAKVLQEEPALPSALREDVPPELDELVLSLLSKDPQSRPGSADDVVGQLHRVAQPRRAPGPGPGTRSGFVGRTEELAQLHAALDAAAAGRGGLTLLLGEPGIGKTRTALELAHQAAAQGWTVLTGRCHDQDSVPAFWPWTRALRVLVQELPEPVRQALPHRAALAALVPELGEEGVVADPEASRFLLFQAVADLLTSAAARAPVVVLIDDAHWMDPASQALTRHVTREVATANVALVLCARDVTSHEEPAASAVVSDLTAAAGRTITMSGLTREQTRDLVEATLRVRPDRWLLRDLHERTDGNPFHVSELVRLLQSEHRITPEGGLRPGEQVVPTGVRDVLRRRLRQVSPECAQLLRTLSVAGREAPTTVLCRMSGRPAAEVLSLLDEAVSARLVVRSTASGFRFAHALVQEALYDELPTCERTELHRRAMAALQDVHGRGPDVPAVEMAHHAVRAQVDGDVAPTVLWSVRAARVAASAAAHEDAVLHLGRAVELAVGLPEAPEGVPRYGELLLELGEAQRRLGQSEQAQLTFLRAAELALLDDDAELLARSALGYGLGLGGFGFVGHADGVLLSLLEEAAAALGEQDSSLRMRVLARLATELYFTPFRRRRLLLSAQALEIAHRLGDPADEVLALYSRTLAVLGPDGLDERRRTASRVVQLAGVVNDPDIAFRGHQLRLMSALEQGDLEQAANEAQACRRIADLHLDPAHAWQAQVFEAMLPLAAGRLDEALRLSNAAVQLGRHGSSEIAQVMHGAQLLVVHWARGRLEEVLDGVRAFADLFPHAPAWRAALAFCCTEIGREDEARVHLDALAGRGFVDLPEDGNYLTTASLLAAAAARLGDVERSRLLLAKLEPYADRHVVLAAGAVAFASVRLPLGLVREACGARDAALQDVAAAHALHRAAGNPVLGVWSGTELVRLLLDRGTEDDRRSAREVLEQVLPVARQVGMPAHVLRLEASAAAAGLGSPVADGSGNAVTILISDVAGSTELTERLGERQVHVLLGEHHALVQDTARREGGVLLKVLGDAVVLAFSSSGAALRCGAAVQRHYEQVDRSPVRVRIGIHTGPVLRQGDSMYGRTMILAFRVADRARAGEVLVSADACRAAEEPLPFTDPERLQLKGFSEPQEVHRLVWAAPQAQRPPQD